MIDTIKKRDGSIVSFEPQKISKAVEKAFIAVKHEYTDELLDSLTKQVLATVEEEFAEQAPSVEDIQNIVEKKLVENNLYDIAKEYIIYRQKRQEERNEEEVERLKKIEKAEIKIKKRDGQMVAFDFHEVEKFLDYICGGLKEIDKEAVLLDCKRALYDGIETKEINLALLLGARGRIERDPEYSQLCANILLNVLYKEVLGFYQYESGFEPQYRSLFKSKVLQGVDEGHIAKEMMDFDFEALSQALKPERDGLFQYLGLQVIYDRYLYKDLNQNITETPQYFWMRVAMGLALSEADKTAKTIEFYEVLSTLRYVSSTPTLFHSGTTHPQMSSCYLNTVYDDLTNIFKTFSDNAQLSKWSGGIGTDWTNIRATGARIKSTNVGSQGVVPFLKIADSATAAINRSGKRRGAACVYLEVWHYDYEDFLELRKNTGDERRRTHDMNTASWIPDLFMKRVQNDEMWTLFSPDETPELHHIYGKAFENKYQEYEQKALAGKVRLFKQIKAKELWRKMITMLFETGHPWMTFKDPCNIRSPQDHVGVVHNSNLCTEITLNTSEDETAVCNLGSVNLAKHIKEGKLDTELLSATVKTAIRMLDNVIDLNYYPTKEAQNSNMKHRPIGLGIMGLQDALYLLDYGFESEAAMDFSDEMMEFISYHAIVTSSELAKEKGAYESFKGSKWDRNLFPIDTFKMMEDERGIPTEIPMSSQMDWTPVREMVKQYGMRNSNCMAVAPTATISNISGCFPCIEPIYKNLYVKSNFSGEFTVLNPYLIEDLKKLGLWNQEMLEHIKHHDGSIQQIAIVPEHLRQKYKEVFEISWKALTIHTARRAKWIDQSQSFNLFVKTQSGKEVSEMYMFAWKTGVKTTYYLRSLGASSIEKSTIDINKKFEEEKKPLKACAIDNPSCEACQ